MTKNQFIKKIDVARKSGEANLDNGARLVYHGNNFWGLYSKDHQCIDTSYDPKEFVYICD